MDALRSVVWKTRLAPTPSGFLHVGNALSFLITYCLARVHRGKILLRIDDLDRTRYRREYTEDIFRSLEWLGILWDEGPQSVADFEMHWSQHQRLDLYTAALKQIKENGHCYACRCSRSTFRPGGGQNPYPGTCRDARISLQGQVAWRFPISPEHAETWTDIFLGETVVNPASETGDFIIRRKDGSPAYQLASFIDDRHFQVTHIIRGMDLLPSTAAQRYLARRWPEPNFLKVLFGHHELLTDSAGRKLSKSAGDTALKLLRQQQNALPQLYRSAGKMLGLPSYGIQSLHDLEQLCLELNPF